MANERARERFLNEARISQKLSHPNIVNVYDVQQDGDLFFLTMELLEGQDLRQLMDSRKLARQTFSIDEVIELAKILGAALTYAHTQTVHRDIKPENIWVTENGDYKIMDFGIAQVQSTSQRTKTGAAMGTAYYMAPEQLKGLKDIDGRADQYALAVMIYELLSGEVPAGMIEPLQSHRKDVPKKFAQAIHKALAPKPENRFENIEEFVNALQIKSFINFTLPVKKIGIAVGVLVSLFLLGSFVSGGGLEGLKKLLPMSQEEISQHRAELAKLRNQIQTNIENLKSDAAKLASEIKEAERKKSDTLEELNYTHHLIENVLFRSTKFTNLNGDIAEADSYLRDNRFDVAKQKFEAILATEKLIREEFDVAGLLFQYQTTQEQTKKEWLDNKEEYGLDASPLESAAEAKRTAALDWEKSGEFKQAKDNWGDAIQLWSESLTSASAQINAVKQRWAEERKAEDARRIAIERARQRNIEIAAQQVQEAYDKEVEKYNYAMQEYKKLYRQVELNEINCRSKQMEPWVKKNTGFFAGLGSESYTTADRRAEQYCKNHWRSSYPEEPIAPEAPN